MSRHVLDDVGDRRELVERAVDLDGRDGRALERREQHAAERVADRDAEAALERLARELAVELVERLGVERDALRTDQVAPVAAIIVMLLMRHARLSSVREGSARGPSRRRRTRLAKLPVSESRAAGLPALARGEPAQSRADQRE